MLAFDPNAADSDRRFRSSVARHKRFEGKPQNVGLGMVALRGFIISINTFP